MSLSRQQSRSRSLYPCRQVGRLRSHHLNVASLAGRTPVVTGSLASLSSLRTIPLAATITLALPFQSAPVGNLPTFRRSSLRMTHFRAAINQGHSLQNFNPDQRFCFQWVALAGSSLTHTVSSQSIPCRTLASNRQVRFGFRRSLDRASPWHLSPWRFPCGRHPVGHSPAFGLVSLAGHLPIGGHHLGHPLLDELSRQQSRFRSVHHCRSTDQLRSHHLFPSPFRAVNQS
jgi:hypothetical protein